MSEVARIGATWNDICESIQLRESTNGEYVAYEDYAALKAGRDALAAENVALKSAIVVAKDDLQEHYDTDGVDSQDGEGNLMDACVRLCDAKSTIEKLESITTPATDAYLSSVRAEGVDKVTGDMDKLAGAMLNRTLDSGSKQAVAYAECAAMVAKFAAKLRAGEPS